jgi:hypothetical protein
MSPQTDTRTRHRHRVPGLEEKLKQAYGEVCTLAKWRAEGPSSDSKPQSGNDRIPVAAPGLSRPGTASSE